MHLEQMIEKTSSELAILKQMLENHKYGLEKQLAMHSSGGKLSDNHFDFSELTFFSFFNQTPRFHRDHCKNF